MQTVPFDAYLGAGKTGLAIGATIYQLDGSTVATAFSTAGFYEAPAGSGDWHHEGLSLPDAGGVIAVGVSGTEYKRVAVEAAKLLASGYTAPPTVGQIDTQLSGTHGAGAWDTATGFATPTDVTDAQTAIEAAIDALNNLSSSDVAAELTTYDAATQADLTATQTDITDAIAALNDLNGSDILTLSVETGHDVLTVLRALYAAARGKSITDDPESPTYFEYLAPDDTTVRLRHDISEDGTTRSVTVG